MAFWPLLIYSALIYQKKKKVELCLFSDFVMILKSYGTLAYWSKFVKQSRFHILDSPISRLSPVGDVCQGSASFCDNLKNYRALIFCA